MRHIILFLFETILYLFAVATDSTQVGDNMCLCLCVVLMIYIITVKIKEEKRKEQEEEHRLYLHINIFLNPLDYIYI
jgi:small neutral amino acid transporter SnatA (MarC family)